MKALADYRLGNIKASRNQIKLAKLDKDYGAIGCEWSSAELPEALQFQLKLCWLKQASLSIPTEGQIHKARNEERDAPPRLPLPLVFICWNKL